MLLLFVTGDLLGIWVVLVGMFILSFGFSDEEGT
jgi:hypothetical protein